MMGVQHQCTNPLTSNPLAGRQGVFMGFWYQELILVSLGR